MLAVKNGEKPSLGISKLLILMDLQYLPLNIGFTLYTPNIYVFRVLTLTRLVKK